MNWTYYNSEEPPEDWDCEEEEEQDEPEEWEEASIEEYEQIADIYEQRIYGD